MSTPKKCPKCHARTYTDYSNEWGIYGGVCKKCHYTWASKDDDIQEQYLDYVLEKNGATDKKIFAIFALIIIGLVWVIFN